jgi:ABC-type polysaccharide/polyol phosphate export permease
MSQHARPWFLRYRAQAAIRRETGARRAKSEWIENRPTQGKRSLGLPELWASRELVGFLALRDLKGRYKQAVFGLAWGVVQPLAGMLVLTLVFRHLAHVPSDHLPYIPFVLVGYSFWSYVASTISGMTTSFVINAPLITKVYFPRLSIPIGALLPSLVDLAISMIVIAVSIVAYGVTPTVAILTLPLWILALMAVAFASGLLLGTLNVQYRDVGQVVGLLTQLWFFASPVAYPASLVHGRWLWAYELNPVVGVLNGARWSLLGGPAPGRTAVMSLIGGLALFVAAIWYFLANERRFADII